MREFDGAKYVVLAQVSWMGGKNPFLGIAYLVVGGVCFVLGIVFLIVHLVSGRYVVCSASIIVIIIDLLFH